MLTCDEEKEEKEHVLRKLGQAQLLFPVTVKVHLFWRPETSFEETMLVCGQKLYEFASASDCERVIWSFKWIVRYQAAQ